MKKSNANLVIFTMAFSLVLSACGDGDGAGANEAPVLTDLPEGVEPQQTVSVTGEQHYVFQNTDGEFETRISDQQIRVESCDGAGLFPPSNEDDLITLGGCISVSHPDQNFLIEESLELAGINIVSRGDCIPAQNLGQLGPNGLSIVQREDNCFMSIQTNAIDLGGGARVFEIFLQYGNENGDRAQINWPPMEL